MLVLIFLYVAAVYFTEQNPEVENTTSSDQRVLGYPDSQIKSIPLNSEITAAWFLVSEPTKLNLKSNLQDKQTAQTIFQNENCQFLVSSGFYDPQGRHIGLFQYKNNTISPFQSNELFDGFLTVNQFGTPMIGPDVPNDESFLALQSGPLLFQNGHELDLNLESDKNSRRVIAAVTGENKLLFIILYSNKQSFSGPLLKEVPDLLDTFVDKTGQNIADAINLDGGKASAFIGPRFKLTEISIIGGYFCYTN